MPKGNIFCTGKDQLHAFYAPTKINKFAEGVMIILMSGKKSAITFGEGCTLMLDAHVYSAFMAWNLGYLAKKVHDIPPTLTKNDLFVLTWFFMYTLYAYKRIYTLIIFSFWIYNSFVGKKIPNLEPHPTRRHVINELPITSICDCDWLINEIWFFLSAECHHAF